MQPTSRFQINPAPHQGWLIKSNFSLLTASKTLNFKNREQSNNSMMEANQSQKVGSLSL